jgi:hypothetical protein
MVLLPTTQLNNNQEIHNYKLSIEAALLKAGPAVSEM